ncbi:unnamed protein product [Eruca vesicaria subsp. sativa]|uniref:RING-type E3 ubiquitin transferase n=1 Tax=Eruca vesicaria subsp. sativa TaxID=29727 RepID=A0ABC8K2A8_ERUVS|nr:unnamed protein product [Eruca vesicaria subsp. sativa]
MATFHPLCSLFLLFLLTSSTTSLTVSSLLNPNPFKPPRIPYSDHCNHIVPSSPTDPSPSSSSTPASLAFDVSFFSGGDSFFNQNSSSVVKAATFRPKSIRKTLGDGEIYRVEARLSLQIANYGGGLGGQRKIQIEGRRIPVSFMGGQSFDFYGFWSERTGRVCLVGSGQVLSKFGTYKSVDARLVLNYSKESNIYGSLVKGVLESVDKESDFETVSLLGARTTPLNYEYKSLEGSECGKNSEESLSLESVVGGLCKVFEGRSHVYKTTCGGSGTNHSCSEYMSLLSLLCDGEKMRMVLSFSNVSGFSRLFPFDPRDTLVAEGGWDVEKSRFCGVACRILNFTDSLSNAVVGDCSLRLSLRFPAALSITRTAPVVGELWSGETGRIEFSSINDPLWRFSGLRYEYTESKRVGELCKKRSKSKGKHYPDAQTSDMRFVMSVKDSGGGGNVLRSARASPYFVGDKLYHDLLVRGQGVGLSGVPMMNVNSVTKSFTNITYKIRFLNPVTESRGDIYAEGTYDRETGELCMVGCQSVKVNSTVDCSLVIRFKFSPIDSKSDDRLKGYIESTREKTDPLYVGRMEVVSRSIYVHQAKESVWRMDLEIAMVLISNTLSCLFVGMQLYHMSKHQETLPFISIAMLTLLVLGHMIPLLLNFEELFKSGHNNQESLFFENDRWLEAKEIVVRIVTMIAFLLECRLLQLAWSGRKNAEDHHRDAVWDAEKMVSYVCLPLYITGGLIAWLVNHNRTPKRVVYIGKPRARNLLYRPVTLKRTFQRPSLWKDLKSYGGLMLDAFLLPQILFNGFSNSDSKSLAASFYVGHSFVRLLPHAYDLYRSHSYGKILDWSFIYASHKVDYYSTAWDIIILCIGFVFAVVVFLQQRFGGRCFIPKSFIEDVRYEKVVELQQPGELHKSNDS